MIARTRRDELILLEAEAIVEAEWLRLTLDEQTSEGESSDPTAEKTAPCHMPPRATPTIATIDCRRVSPPHHGSRQFTSAHPRRQVWPTQRSPP